MKKEEFLSTFGRKKPFIEIHFLLCSLRPGIFLLQPILACVISWELYRIVHPLISVKMKRWLKAHLLCFACQRSLLALPEATMHSLFSSGCKIYFCCYVTVQQGHFQIVSALMLLCGEFLLSSSYLALDFIQEKICRLPLHLLCEYKIPFTVPCLLQEIFLKYFLARTVYRWGRVSQSWC